MSYHVYITEDADKDLRAIFSYIAYELLSFENAAGQLVRLQKEISSLEDMPERYQRYELEPWCSRGVRRLPVDNYCVFYLPNRERRSVDILRILYAGSDMDRTMTEYDDIV